MTSLRGILFPQFYTLLNFTCRTFTTEKGLMGRESPLGIIFIKDVCFGPLFMIFQKKVQSSNEKFYAKKYYYIILQQIVIPT